MYSIDHNGPKYSEVTPHRPLQDAALGYINTVFLWEFSMCTTFVPGTWYGSQIVRHVFTMQSVYTVSTLLVVVSYIYKE